ncbi:MAG: M23 family metallopeptidase, partial [Spirochaetota bacterium]
FSLVFLSILLSGILAAFFFSSTYFSGLSRMLSTKAKNLENTETSLETVRDEIAELKKISSIFEGSLAKTLDALGLENPLKKAANTSTGDLSSFFGVEEQKEGILKELGDLQSLSTFMQESVESLEKITDLLISHGALLVELPTLWPLEGNRGVITNYFGPAEHPITHKWYLHKGIDISYRLGAPILATADGKVVEKKFEPLGFGNFIVIRHKYGFFTKYAHLSTVNVKEGELVSQGQVVGTLGNTGVSTGPHLHYEVRIGSQVVDPERYLSIKSGLKNVSYKNN